MAKTLQDEIDLTHTYRCPVCETDFLANCPNCGESGCKPRISVREKSLTAYIYRHLPRIVVHLVNFPLMKEIIKTAGTLDVEPTRENADFPIVHLVLDSMEKFFEYYDTSSREQMFRSAWKILIVKLSDPHYRMLFEWWVCFMAKRIEETGFKRGPIPKTELLDHWKEPLEVS